MTCENLLRVKNDIKQLKQNISAGLIRNILVSKNYDRRSV